MRQKLHLLTSKGDFRPALQYALLTQERITVTNAHALVSHANKDIFDQSFIDTIPEGEWLIDVPTLKLMCKAKTTYHIEHTNTLPDMVIDDKGAISKHGLLKNGENVSAFPRWESVIPERKNIVELSAIQFNPRLLADAQQAIDPDFPIIMEFTGHDKAILLRTPNAEIKDCIAIIMPQIITE
jgi:hypothetical protein